VAIVVSSVWLDISAWRMKEAMPAGHVM